MNSSLMHIDLPIKLIGCAITLTIFVLVGSEMLNYRSFNEVVDSREAVDELGKLHGQILLYDEVLTMSARMACSTGDKEWVVRYYHHEPLLSQAIASAIDAVDDLAIEQAARKTDDANALLVKMEEDALRFVEENQPAQGDKILRSPEYAKQKARYQAGINQMLLMIQESCQQTISAQRRQFFTQFFAAPLFAIFGIAFWGWVYRQCQHWRRAFSDLLKKNADAQKTLQSRAEEAELLTTQARISRERFQKFFDMSGEAIFIHDEDLRIHDVNVEATKLYGYSRPQLLGRQLDEIDTQLSAKQLREFLGNVRSSTGQIAALTTTHKRRAKDDIRVSLRCRQLENEKGETFFISSMRDVTEFLAYEEKLRIARDQAVESSQAKSDFVASMSHELRTPLNGIIGMTQLLETTELSRKQKNYIDVCRSSGETLLKVIGDILDFSKIEAGKLRLDPRPVNLLTLIEGVVQATALGKESDTVELVCFVDPTLDRDVVADSDRISQIMFNLIGNAIKFTPRGSIIVSARCLRTDDTSCSTEICIRDTGIGIPSERIATLFDAFTQADSSTTRQYGGTGLGLAITRQLVDLMDGTITVESEVNVGSEFRIQLQLPTFDKDNGLVDAPGFEIIRQLRVAAIGFGEATTKVIAELFEVWGVNCLFTQDAKPGDLLNYHTVLIDEPSECSQIELVRQLRALSPSEPPTLIPFCEPGYELSNEEYERLGTRAAILKPICQSRLFESIVESAAKRKPQTQEHDRAASLQKSHNSIRILLAEDNAVNQIFAQEIFDSADLRHTTVANGKQVLETLCDDPDYDVILMDCHMPVMDGFEATRQLRELMQEGTLPRIPILALTANALAEQREACLDAGMDHYLSKPYNINDLLSAIDRLTNCDSKSVQAGETKDPSCLFPNAIDLDELSERCNGDQYIVSRILATVHNEIEQLSDRLHQAIAENSLQEISIASHSIKGAASLASANRLSKVAATIESNADSKDIHSVRQQLPEFGHAVEELLVSLAGITSQSN